MRRSSVVKKASTTACSAQARCRASNAPYPSASNALARSIETLCGLKGSPANEINFSASFLGLKNDAGHPFCLALPCEIKYFLDRFCLRADSRLTLVIGQTIQSADIKVNLSHGISVLNILPDILQPSHCSLISQKRYNGGNGMVRRIPERRGQGGA